MKNCNYSIVYLKTNKQKKPSSIKALYFWITLHLYTHENYFNYLFYIYTIYKHTSYIYIQ